MNKTFPDQLISDRRKTKEWAKQQVQAALDLTLFAENNGIRKTWRDKQVLYDLYAGVLTKGDVDEHTAATGIKYEGFPSEYQNFPFYIPAISELIGEERNRPFDWQVISSSPNTISAKEEAKKANIMFEVSKYFQNKEINRDALAKQLEKVQQYNNYTYKDLKEVTATRLLKYYYKTLEMKEKFSQGFEDFIIGGEEIYRIDKLGGSLYFDKLDPLQIYTLRQDQGYKLEDSDNITHIGYYSLGWVIDNYYDVLSKEQIKELRESVELTGKPRTNSYNPADPLRGMNNSRVINGIIVPSGVEVTAYGGGVDIHGKVRVVHHVWKSNRKMGKLKYFDENGDEQMTIVNDGYKPDPEKGEEVKWFWPSEWWEATLIGDDIYVKCQPREVQVRDSDNLSVCHSGYVGTVNNTNGGRAVSILGTMRPYIYSYAEIANKVMKVLRIYHPPQIDLDLAGVPKGWTLEHWMNVANETGYRVKDSFKQMDDGDAKFGSFNNQDKTYFNNLSGYISEHIQLMDKIEDMAGSVIGVTKGRLGQIHERESVRNVQIARSQYSNITEKAFALHDGTKLRAMRVLLEYAKACKGNKIHYILDDTQAFTIDPNDISEENFNILISTSSNVSATKNKLEDLAHAGLQNGVLDFSQVMDIMMSDDIAEIRRKIETAETEKRLRDQQQSQQALQAQQQQQQAKVASEKYKADQDALIKLEGYEKDRDVARIRSNDDESTHREREIDIKDRALQETERKNRVDEEIKKGNKQEKKTKE